jgi:hypothetical protein
MSSPNRAGNEVLITPAVPDCGRCGGEGLLSAHVPHGWDRADGRRVDGIAAVVLCPACDVNDTASGALITYFHVHGRVTPETLEQCAGLLQAWVDSIEVPAVDLDQLNAEAEAWYRNEL